MKNNFKKGISLISLIIIIIVIIILVAIILFNGINTPNSANFAKFTQQVDNVQMAVTNKYGKLLEQHSIANESRTQEQIYLEIATGADQGINSYMCTTGNQFKTESSESTGIQNITVEGAKNSSNSIGMTLPKVRESNEAWYVTKEGIVFNSNGYVYNRKTFFTPSLYQEGELEPNYTNNSERAEIIYPFINNGSNVVTGIVGGTESNSTDESSELTVYSITITINNGSYIGATSISKNGTATVTISANNNYSLPSEVTVTGATQSYNSATGVISLSNPTGNVAITVTCANANTTQSVSDINIGDYVEMIPDSNSYTISTSLTGYSSSQTIQPNELSLWRVISINDDGTVDLVSEYTSSNYIYFSGITGFKVLVSSLQTIAAQYAKSGYTKDTRMIGYDGQTLSISNTSSMNSTYVLSNSATPSPTSGTGQEYNNGILGDTLYLKDYLLVKNVYNNLQTKDVNGGNGQYYLASRFYGRPYWSRYDW